MQKLITGVPQGSILGPLLYIIYVNDIVRTIPEDKLITFADDTTILNTSNTIENLEIDTFITINQVAAYFENIGMKINLMKTQFMHFNLSTRRNLDKKNINVLLSENQLTQTDFTKFLGITVDSRLCWNEQIDQLSSKLASGIYIIRKISRLNNKKLILNCYYAFIFSHISSSIILWGVFIKSKS